VLVGQCACGHVRRLAHQVDDSPMMILFMR
jgi:hypothetical protein